MKELCWFCGKEADWFTVTVPQTVSRRDEKGMCACAAHKWTLETGGFEPVGLMVVARLSDVTPQPGVNP